MNIENSRDYYGNVLQGSGDLRTDACCTLEQPSPALAAALANVHPGVKARYYGCGLVAPAMIKGATILDLGSGAGQDAYVLAQMVGAGGSVVGIDATAQQLAVAQAHRAWHAERFGFANVAFHEGDIEHLDALPLQDGTFDVIVSNCVINLVADKGAVFRAAHRLLKPGGEMYFSDVYADRRLPAAWRDDPGLHGECLAGASYWGDFLALAKASGFADPRLVADRPLAVSDPVRGEGRRHRVLLRDVAAVQARRPRPRMRGLRPGGALPRPYRDRRAGRGRRRLRPRQAPRDRGRPRGPGLRQTLGACWPRRASRRPSRFSATFRATTGSSPAAAAACPSIGLGPAKLAAASCC